MAPCSPLAFSPDGASALCAAPSGVFRLSDGRWTGATAPDGAAPARAIAFGATPGRVYLLGSGWLVRERGWRADLSAAWRSTRPGGGRDHRARRGDPAARDCCSRWSTARSMASEDGGRHWRRVRSARRRRAGRHGGGSIPSSPAALWAGGRRTASIVSDDLGATWQRRGAAAARARDAVRGIAADPTATIAGRDHAPRHVPQRRRRPELGVPGGQPARPPRGRPARPRPERCPTRSTRSTR